MAVTNSRLSYSDCFNLFDQALADPRGVRIKFVDYGDAFHFRTRLNKARVIDRQDNREIYSEGHKLYGRSVYDDIQAKIRSEDSDGEYIYWLYLEKVSAANYEVENLSGIDESTDGDNRQAQSELEE